MESSNAAGLAASRTAPEEDWPACTAPLPGADLSETPTSEATTVAPLAVWVRRRCPRGRLGYSRLDIVPWRLQRLPSGWLSRCALFTAL